MSVGMQFTFQIELGNDAMRTREDVIRALRATIFRLEYGHERAKIVDPNGNVVGEWSYENDEENDAEEDES